MLDNVSGILKEMGKIRRLILLVQTDQIIKKLFGNVSVKKAHARKHMHKTFVMLRFSKFHRVWIEKRLGQPQSFRIQNNIRHAFSFGTLFMDF